MIRHPPLGERKGESGKGISPLGARDSPPWRPIQPENGFCPRITRMDANKIKRIEMGGHVPNCVSMGMLQMPPIREDSRDSRALLRFSGSTFQIHNSKLLPSWKAEEKWGARPSWVHFPAFCRGKWSGRMPNRARWKRAPWKRIALRLLARQRRSINLRTPAARRPHRAPYPPPPADQGRGVGNTSRALCPGTPHGAALSGWVR